MVGADPNRIYKAKEIKELKEAENVAKTPPAVIKKIHKKGTEADPLARPLQDHHRRQARRGGIRAGQRPARHRADPTAGGGRHRGVPQARGPSPRRRRLVCQADSVKIGYEISFTRYFYKPQPMRSLEEIRTDILALEKETEGLLDEIIGSTGR